MATAAIRPLFQKILTSTALGLPIIYYIHERIYTIHTISTTSMEPSLQKGDVILIRKVDFLPYYHDTPGLDVQHLEEGTIEQQLQRKLRQLQRQKNDGEDEIHKKNHPQPPERLDSLLDRETDRLKALKIDASIGRPAGNELTLWRSPPNSSPGEVVVVRCPEAFSPERWDVGRLVGLGSQRLRALDSYHKIESIPPYSIWIEADNTKGAQNRHRASTYSEKYGPVSKKLLVGQVERVIWPPKRWGKIERLRPPVGRAWWP